MIYLERPEQFNPRFEIVGCYFQHDGQFLLLRRHEHKSHGGKWGVVAGKIDPGEDMITAMAREALEETGHSLSPEDLAYFKSVFVNHGGYDLIYHMFATNFESKPAVTVNPDEHAEYRWVKPVEALEMNLIDDLDECIRMYYP